jgi:large subunit ribosomal protein L22
MEGRATARYVRTSAQKAGLVMDLIRGRMVDDALALLRFTRKSVAKDISKVLRSAVANLQQREGASDDTDRLRVDACYANQGPSLKRIRPAAMGRAFRITKRTSHLTVSVREQAEAVTAIAAGAPEAAAKTTPENASAAGSRTPRRRRRGRSGR